MDNLRTQVWQANLSLWKERLVYGTQGNVSGVDRKRKQLVIKPSGVPYEDLKESMLVWVDLNGKTLSRKWKPSVDTVHHLYLYRHIPEIRGVCHTHSKYVTVFSILGISIPVHTTAQADVFGKEIPVTKYVDNQGDAIGQAVLSAYRRTGCPAVILGKHGLFALGESPAEAAFHALMAEYCAEVSFQALALAKALGKTVTALAGPEIAKWFGRYHSERYGQKR